MTKTVARSTTMRALFLVMTVLVGIVSVPSNAQVNYPQVSYLLARNAATRCESLNTFVNAVHQISPSGDVASAASLFTAPFSRFFGRQFDDLTNKHLKQIRKDLAKCGLDQSALAAQLKLPFDPKKARKTEAGQRWLREIYKASTPQLEYVFRGSRVQLDSTQLAGCSAADIRKAVSPSFINQGAFEELQGVLRPYLNAGKILTDKRLMYGIEKYRKELQYLLDSVSRSPQRRHAPDIFRDIVEGKLEEIERMTSTADSSQLFSEYGSALVHALEPSIQEVRTVSASLPTWRELARFEYNLTRHLVQKCIKGHPVFAKSQPTNEDWGRINQALGPITGEIKKRLQRIVAEQPNLFIAEIDKINSDSGLTRFRNSVVDITPLTKEVLRGSKVMKTYSEMSRQYEDHKRREQQRLASIDKAIADDAKQQLSNLNGWELRYTNILGLESRTLSATVSQNSRKATVYIGCSAERDPSSWLYTSWALGDRMSDGSRSNSAFGYKYSNEQPSGEGIEFALETNSQYIPSQNFVGDIPINDSYTVTTVERNRIEISVPNKAKWVQYKLVSENSDWLFPKVSYDTHVEPLTRLCKPHRFRDDSVPDRIPFSFDATDYYRSL